MLLLVLLRLGLGLGLGFMPILWPDLRLVLPFRLLFLRLASHFFGRSQVGFVVFVVFTMDTATYRACFFLLDSLAPVVDALRIRWMVGAAWATIIISNILDSESITGSDWKAASDVFCLHACWTSLLTTKTEKNRGGKKRGSHDC